MTDTPEKPELEGITLVALGRFNPAIFQPLWFSENNLIRKEEAAEANVGIIHRDISAFTSEWFALQVTDDRFSLETSDPTKYKPLQDLVLGTFKVLEHTPIRAFGLNYHQHFVLDSEDEQRRFLTCFAPGDPWERVLQNPGMQSLTMQGKRSNCDADHIQVKIEPSRKVETGVFGVFIHVNEHYQVPEDDNLGQSDRMAFFLSTVQSVWDEFHSYCKELAGQLFDECKTEEQ